jgi:hypothetical protein
VGRPRRFDTEACARQWHNETKALDRELFNVRAEHDHWRERAGAPDLHEYNREYVHARFVQYAALVAELEAQRDARR